MAGAWNQWEGQVINGTFHLRHYLGGCGTSAVFLTERERDPQKAAIKLIPASPELTKLQLSRWDTAAKLSHPHLMRLFQTGCCQLGGMALLYLVMEYAEENLSEILPQRPLTRAETREILEPILDALAYVHGQGFVHGHIKPANIMGVDDQLKISADGLWRMADSRAGLRKRGVYDAPEIVDGAISPAADVWSLGMTLVETLTQRLPVWQQLEQAEPVLPENLPAPFSELARHCLRRDAQRRWTIAEIAAHLRPPTPAPSEDRTACNQTVASPQAASAKWRYVASALALGAVVAAMLVAPRLFKRQPGPQRSVSAVVEQSAIPPKIERPVIAPKPEATSVPGQVIHEVLPTVPRSARSTISGTVKVVVRVHVDASGNVAGAELDSQGPSRYFAGLALQAARGWKFAPPKADGQDASSEWHLRFEFRNSGTRVFPVRLAAR
ncbi:MAG TPA: TonB family protein [Terriglobales bacterium]|nr:TonB family protein [Terriglobales bacterium]